MRFFSDSNISGTSRPSSISGFSLVELMVVVAIIGVLAMVGVPRVQRFISKAQTSEAQVSLGTLHTLSKNFYAEFTGYTNHMGVLGYVPEGNIRYNVGWSPGATVGPNTYALKKGIATFPSGGELSAKALCATNCQLIKGSDGNDPPDSIPSTVAPVAPFQSYRAGAIANLVTNAPPDIWRIDENKVIQNITDGTID